MAKRNLYLKNTPVDDALEQFMEAVRKRVSVRYETISVLDALDRITSQAVYARCCSPLFNSAAMDGIAVVAENTAGASEASPKVLEPEDYLVINTGNPIREPYNAVIMAEDAMELGEGRLQITAAAAPWQHIRPIGEDIVTGEMILPGRHKIRPIDIGVLTSAGIREIEVVKKPEVAIYPTGSEIVELTDDNVKEGNIIESNSRMFENMVKVEGGNPHRFSILADDPDVIREAMKEACENYDMVLINAGTSAGTKDYTVHVLRELGEVLIHGVAVKPGKPVILAIVNGKPVIGLPGYPVSAYIGFVNFVTPVLQYMSNETAQPEEFIKARISRRLVSSLKYREYVRVKVGRVGDKIIAAPLSRGAGAAMSLVRADGLCVIPQNSEGVEAGDEVEVALYRPLKEVENTAVLIGSHDLILDIIGDMMPNHYAGKFVSSTHVGSMAGLMSLKRGECHMAPTHLLNEEDGVYNLSYLKSMFREPMALIKGVERIQGLMVKKGNPCGITGIESLPGKRYVNRQRGAGTRVLLDYRLKKLGISPEEINGYEREAGTHMAVAAAVESDSADVGMGILSAARAMNLDFIEIGPEEYDFAVPVKFLELPVVQAFIEILKSGEFHEKLEELGGYGYKRCGEVVII